MRFAKLSARALALVPGGAAIVATGLLGAGLSGAGLVAAPALAKDKKPDAAAADKPASYDLSKPVRDAVAAAQKALAANDVATAATQINTALAAAKTDDDRFVASNVLFDISKKTGDKAQQNQALEGMLVGTRLPASQRQIILLALGQTALLANDLPKADRLLSEGIQIPPATPTQPDAYNGFALLAETKAKEGKPADAVAVFQQAMTQAKTAGAKLPADFYGRAINIAYTAKLAPQTEALTQAWVEAYPTRDNWRDSIVTWRDLHRGDAELDLDFMRLQRSIGALKGQADYMELVDAIYQRTPGEAKAVLDEGVKAGAVNLQTSQNAREINGIVSGKIAADKGSLAASAANAKGPKGTGRGALNTGDAYASYGDYANAIAMYRLALEKGGVDANLVNTRLGVALVKSGDKAGAKTVFASVTGSRASLARYWVISLDNPVA